jgi:hypothetical protein
VIGRFTPLATMEKRLRNYAEVEKDERHGKTFELTSLVRLNAPLPFGRQAQMFSGIVMHEYIRTPQILLRKDGTYEIADGEPYKDTQFGRFWLTTAGIAVSESIKKRSFSFDVLSDAMISQIKPVVFRVGDIARDYNGHWMGDVNDRPGHVQSGVFYGEEIEEDSLIRQEYRTWKHNQVGFKTSHFGPVTKIRITKDGAVTVYRDLYDRMDLFFRFVIEELLPYAA